ncbi:hypothetical protein GGS20DRAFT_219230 [Poronia punctata]|nr:hypothetical protein GGS20DRAFT_219230 [Poronia punctata]
MACGQGGSGIQSRSTNHIRRSVVGHFIFVSVSILNFRFLGLFRLSAYFLHVVVLALAPPLCPLWAYQGLHLDTYLVG